MILSLREKLTGVIAIAIIGLLAIPLAFVGVESLFLNSSRVTNVGSVNGEDISELDFRRAVAARESQFANLFGDNVPSDLVDPKLIESSAANGLVELYLYLTHAMDSGMGVTEEYASTQIRQSSLFQNDGQFSEAIYTGHITRLGYTSSRFIEAMSDELLSNTIRNGIQTSAIATEMLLQSNVAVSQENRDYQTITLPVSSVIDSVEISESEIGSYYEENSAQFALPERVSLNYVELNSSMFESGIEIPKEDVEKRFELVKETLPVRRQPAHILVELKDDNGHVDTLDAIQAALETGKEFGEVAAEFSDDIGTAGNGGLLGYSEGSTFPEPFETALAELSLNEVSQPVLTEAGFHVIKLIDLDQQEFSLENEYASLEQQLVAERAVGVYRENLQTLTDASYSTDNLVQLIEQFSDIGRLEIKSTDTFSRQSGAGIAQNETIRGVAFSDIVLNQKLNSEVVELDQTRAVVVHLQEYFEPGTAALEDVRNDIETLLKRDKGTEALEERAALIRQKLEQGATPEDVAREEDLEWQVQLGAQRGAGGVIADTIFDTALAGDFPVIGSNVLANGDYLIYSIDSASVGSLDDFNNDQTRQFLFQLSRLVSSGEGRAYLDTLRAEADIDFKIDVDLR